MNITTKNVDEGKSMYPQRLDAGIHEVTITQILSGTSAIKGTPYIDMVFTDKAAQTHKETFYMSETKGQSGRSAMDISLERIKHIATKVVEASSLDAVTASSVPDYATKLEYLLKDKLIRIKLCSREQVGSKGNIYVEKHFNYFPFAEDVSGPKVLKFNEAYDCKKLANGANGAMTRPGEAIAVEDDELPF